MSSDQSFLATNAARYVYNAAIPTDTTRGSGSATQGSSSATQQKERVCLLRLQLLQYLLLFWKENCMVYVCRAAVWKSIIIITVPVASRCAASRGGAL